MTKEKWVFVAGFLAGIMFILFIQDTAKIREIVILIFHII
jgi:hypothetical protein